MKRKCNLPLMAMYIAASLFFLGSLKVPKMILSYLHIPGNITLFAVGIFALLDAVLLFVAARDVLKNRRWKYFFVLAAVNLLYLLPYVIHRQWYQLVQYVVLMVPFTLCAYLLVTREDGKTLFFRCLQNMSRYFAPVFLLYIVVLFVAEPGEFGIVEIREMSYGDIAYAAIPFLFADVERFLDKSGGKKVYTGLRILLYVMTVLYSGTRSAMFCVVVAFLIQFVMHFSYIKTVKLSRKAICAGALVACLLFCNIITPAGARLNVVKGNLLYELTGKDFFQILAGGTDNMDDPTATEETDAEGNPLDPEEWPDDVKLVYNEETHQFQTIDAAFQYYVVRSDRPISETQKLLQEDIKTDAGKYITATEDYRTAAGSYKLPMNERAYLWSTALGEFNASKLIGNGCLHYQNKYETTFPHNVVLELLADFGVVGFLVFFGIVISCFALLMVQAIREKNATKGTMLAFVCVYIPMHLLFHSLYFNGILLFTVSYLILETVKHTRKGMKAYEVSE